MNALCYVCNGQTSDWCRNFTEIRSQCTDTPISCLIRTFLDDFETVRNIDDESNCICVECLQQIDNYDRTCQQAVEQRTKLRNLLLSTETKFREECVEPIEIKQELEDCPNEIAVFHESEDLMTKTEVKIESHTDTVQINERRPTTEPELSPTQPSSTSCSKLIETSASESDLLAKQKHFIIRKDGRLFRARLVKRQKSPQPVGGLSVKAPANGNVSVMKSSNGKIIRMIVKPNAPAIDGAIEPAYDANAINPLENPVNEEIENGMRQYKQRRSCTVCGKIYTNKHLYERHLNTHARECNECGITFKEIGVRKFEAHRKWHERYPGFACHICYFTFDDKTAFKNHMKLHETKPHLECLFCGKSFKTNRLIKNHVKVHEERERDKLCDTCGKAYVTIQALERHVNTHTKERLYACSICSKRFVCITNMKHHMRNHSDERPFGCSFCDMKFKHRKHCRAHERRHTEETKTVKCNFCSAAFEHKFYLKKHMERKHGVEIPSKTN